MSAIFPQCTLSPQANPRATHLTHSLFFLPIDSECGAVRDDTNHKLALQVAENKRMQALLAKATDDCNRLTRLCENLSVRVQILESHTGVNH